MSSAIERDLQLPLDQLEEVPVQGLIGGYDDPALYGSWIFFERLESDNSTHGNYNLFVIGAGGTGETKLTDTGYSQGLAMWSHSGDRLVYVVAAIGSEGEYDIYVMNSDGGNSRNITPGYFPAGFLCHSAMFTKGDSKVYFTGQWWK